MVDALEKAGLDVLDLRGPMKKIKKAALAYYRSDNHWTSYGAFAAYAAAMDKLGEWFPALRGAAKGDYEIDIKPGLPGGLAYMLALGDVFKENMVIFTPKWERRAKDAAVDHKHEKFFQPPIAKETGDPGLPRAVVFRDSFSHELVPFLSEHFNRIVYIWPYPTALRKMRLFDKAVIEKEKPQLVIDEFVERYFTEFPPVNGQPAPDDS